MFFFVRKIQIKSDLNYFPAFALRQTSMSVLWSPALAMKTLPAATQMVLIAALADQDFLETDPFAKVCNNDFAKI